MTVELKGASCVFYDSLFCEMYLSKMESVE